MFAVNNVPKIIAGIKLIIMAWHDLLDYVIPINQFISQASQASVPPVNDVFNYTSSKSIMYQLLLFSCSSFKISFNV